MFLHKICTTVLLASATLLAAPIGMAADTPAVIKSLEQRGLENTVEFNVNGEIRAFAGTVDQQPITVYVTKDGNAIIGNRIDANGTSLDNQQVEELVAQPISKAIWQKLENSTWVADGKADAKRIVYTFSDPNCPYCNQFWHNARPWVNAGKVQLRHVMVGVIRADSPTKATTILAATNPSAVLEQNELSFKQGGIKAAESIPEDIQAKLDANQVLMAELGFRGTPGIVFPGKDGLAERLNGMPKGAAMEKVMGSSQP